MILSYYNTVLYNLYLPKSRNSYFRHEWRKRVFSQLLHEASAECSAKKRVCATSDENNFLSLRSAFQVLFHNRTCEKDL